MQRALLFYELFELFAMSSSYTAMPFVQLKSQLFWTAGNFLSFSGKALQRTASAGKLHLPREGTHILPGPSNGCQ